MLELPNLRRDLASLIEQVPRGRVTTPGKLAAALGHRAASIWAASYLFKHDHGPHCPCHRVVRAGGVVGGYIAGTEGDKTRRLAAEGVPFKQGRVALEAALFDNFQSDRPLARLAAMQDELARQITLTPEPEVIETVGGFDVSYSADRGTAAYVRCRWPDGELLWSTTVTGPVEFPYISSFLTFRELPLLVELVDQVRTAGQMSEVVLVDGSGILHPRGIGIAAHFGAVADLPTIGVTKKLLFGTADLDGMQPNELRPVTASGQSLGYAVLPGSGTRRPIFFSPGFRVGVELAGRVVPPLLRGRRLPEPLYWADRLSRDEARAPTSGDLAWRPKKGRAK